MVNFCERTMKPRTIFVKEIIEVDKIPVDQILSKRETMREPVLLRSDQAATIPGMNGRDGVD